jgi:hypothetical protein
MNSNIDENRPVFTKTAETGPFHQNSIDYISKNSNKKQKQQKN